MSLPPGFLDELKARTSLSHVVGRKVTWDRRKSNPARGDLWAPCPFHQEKSASFHVDDRKGFYHCFGCHAGGDVVKFVQEAENLGFMEAVEWLARDAGMAMPAQDPQARARADRAGQLVEVMEAAARFFRLSLVTAAASEARGYLSRRGLDEAALSRFEIGFAPAARRALWDHLTGRGLRPDLIVDSGMAIAPEDGGAPFDRFRDRIMFPIRDPRGRCIAFGGRAMAKDAQAKYLNSPDTPLFDKGHVLFNHGPARTAAAQGATLVVAEGYMDVIALVEGGFGAAVAPLGTAITPHQLELLWRIAPEPVLALDGDKAGMKAAMRLVDVALPLLKPGRSLRVALLPGGKDPDELIRGEGPAAMQAALDAAQPLVEILWRRETEGKVFDSPDRRAALESRLLDLTETIADPMIKTHYRRALRDLQWAAFRPAAPGRRAAGSAVPRKGMEGPSSSVRGSYHFDGTSGDVETEPLEAAVLCVAIATPAVLDLCCDAIADLPMCNPEHETVRSVLLAWHLRRTGALREQVVAEVGLEALENIRRRAQLRDLPESATLGNTEWARSYISEAIDKLSARVGLALEMQEVRGEAGLHEASALWRVTKAREARNQAERRDLSDDSDFETGPNGAKLNRDDRSAFDRLIRDIGFHTGTDSAEDRDEG